MRNNRVNYGLIVFLIFTFINSGCEKELSKEEIRDNFISQFVNEINADSLKSYVEFLQKMGTRFALANNHRQVAINIKNKFIQLGYPEAMLDSFYLTITYNGTVYNTWQYNVMAKREGASASDSICILGAHYDDIVKTGAGDPFVLAPGANDNASGVAATFEIARLMKQKSFNPSATIKFVAFGAEELGLYGSKDFASKSFAANEKIRMMLNNDMIAYQLSPLQSDWYVNIIHYAISQDLRDDAIRICTKNTILKNTTDNKYSAQSDSYPFFLSGYKSLFFIQNIIDNTYHTTNDLAAGLNFGFCREIVKVSCAMLLEKNYRE
jgi:Zn-dependent M28 family amino/carboxypeptidase